MRRRRKPLRKPKRPGILATLHGPDGGRQNLHTCRTLRQAYQWAQYELGYQRRHEVRVYKLVDVVKGNVGSFKTHRVRDD